MARRTPTGADWAQDLPERLVHAAAMALVEHTPGDDHTDPAARKAVVAVLRELTRADCPKTITAIDIRFWANDVERSAPDRAATQPPFQSADAAREWLRSIVVPVYGDVRALRGLLQATGWIVDPARHGGDRTLWDRLQVARQLLDPPAPVSERTPNDG